MRGFFYEALLSREEDLRETSPVFFPRYGSVKPPAVHGVGWRFTTSGYERLRPWLTWGNIWELANRYWQDSLYHVQAINRSASIPNPKLSSKVRPSWVQTQIRKSRIPSGTSKRALLNNLNSGRGGLWCFRSLQMLYEMNDIIILETHRIWFTSFFWGGGGMGGEIERGGGWWVVWLRVEGWLEFLYSSHVHNL